MIVQDTASFRDMIREIINLRLKENKGFSVWDCIKLENYK